LTAKATNLAAQGSKLAKPATTAGDMGTRIARLTGETAFRSGRAGAGFGAGLGFTNAQGELEDRFAAAGGGAVAGGIGGVITTSTNGITWTTRTSNFGGNNIFGMTYGDSLYVAGGYLGTLATAPASTASPVDQPTGVVVHALTDVT
jgi:hypothetical protein